MAIEEHTSLELSRRLYDKGFKGEHEHYWVYDGSPVNACLHRYIVEANNIPTVCPGLTFAEVWKVLPEYIHDKDKDITYYWRIKIDSHKRCCIQIIYYWGALRKVFKSNSPAEAVGLLLEWLIDNGHVEVKQ